MGRWIVMVCAVGLLQACGSFDGTLPAVPGRETFGVSTHQPNLDQSDNATPAASQAAEHKLDWEASQLCTLGTVPVREDVEPGEAGMQLPDRLVRCQPYEFSMFGYSLAHIVPTIPLLDFGPF
jgi:hypothetical protein